MSEPKILEPVSEVPPIKRDMPLRESKWDSVLERAEKAKGKKNPTIPVGFDKYESATSARRRIQERAELLLEHGQTETEFDVEQRGENVYVTAK